MPRLQRLVSFTAVGMGIAAAVAAGLAHAQQKFPTKPVR